MKLKELLRILKDLNFHMVRSNSHIIYSDGKQTIAVPNHKEISRSLAIRVLKQGGISKDIIKQYL
jgi:beta-lactam-binding protein with PASTA domain